MGKKNFFVDVLVGFRKPAKTSAFSRAAPATIAPADKSSLSGFTFQIEELINLLFLFSVNSAPCGEISSSLCDELSSL